MEYIKLNSIIKGLIWALFISVILSILITFLLHFTSISETLLPSFASLIFFLSILLGSTISAKSAGNRGLFHGLGVGILYLFFSIIFGIIVSTDPFSWVLFTKKIAYTLLGGALGGIIGIGLSNQ
ncbi:MAG: hypothetical protein PWQ67_1824 [Clostridia bacterium]|jgi:putative membrane protein (TIGR04086 family)|nr:hypothetical protein [Clostridia bacterium]MDN5323370.1 hypothetical protein [Clostridia bacterium]